MEVPDIAQHAFTSSDAEQWTLLPAQIQQPGRRSLTAQLQVPGYYLAGTDQPTLEFRTRKSSHAAVIVGLVVVLIALALFLWVYVARSGQEPSKAKAKAKPKAKVSGRAGRAR